MPRLHVHFAKLLLLFAFANNVESFILSPLAALRQSIMVTAPLKYENTQEQEGAELSLVDSNSRNGTNTEEIVLPRKSTSDQQVYSLLDSEEKSPRGSPKVYPLAAETPSWRPATKFRLKLGAAMSLGMSLALLVQRPTTLVELLGKWWSSRGFTGLASLGRTVSYVWALFVAYPRMLDRRAAERKERKREKELDRKRREILLLSNEIGRLRQEMSSLDAEIRSFRREIISMTAYSKDNPEVSDAISKEMDHLVSLRKQIQADLAAARKERSDLKLEPPIDASFEF